MPVNPLLTTTPLNRSLTVQALDGPPEMVGRLGELGFIPGAVIQIERRLPFRGPWIVRLGTSAFALRSPELAMIRVRENV